MSLIGKTSAVPYNPDNYVLPSQVSAWFASFNSVGVLGDYLEIGNVAEISAELTEEYLDHESIRKGVNTIDRQLINKVTGSIKLTMDEVVQRNIELIFKPETITTVSDEKVYEQVTLQFTTAGTAINLTDATREYNTTGVTYENVVVTKVRDRAGTEYTVVDQAATPATTDAFIYDNSGTPSDPPTIEINAAYSSTLDASDLENAVYVVTYYVERAGKRYTLQDGISLEGSLRLQMLSNNGPQGIFVFSKVVAKMAGAITISPTEWFKVPMDFTVLTAGDGTRGYYTQLTYHPSFTVS